MYQPRVIVSSFRLSLLHIVCLLIFRSCPNFLYIPFTVCHSLSSDALCFITSRFHSIPLSTNHGYLTSVAFLSSFISIITLQPRPPFYTRTILFLSCDVLSALNFVTPHCRRLLPFVQDLFKCLRFCHICSLLYSTCLYYHAPKEYLCIIDVFLLPVHH
jgi:hypothetical protein